MWKNVHMTNIPLCGLLSIFVKQHFWFVKQLRSPMQIVMAVDVDQRRELQAMIYDLEEENRWQFYKYYN